MLSGGVYKRPKLNIFGFSFCPQGPRLAAPQGTSTRGARDLDSRRHRFESRSHGAASRGPLRRESRSLVAPRVEVPGDKIKTQKCWVLAVYRPLRPKSAIPHPITIQNMRFEQKMVNNPFNWVVSRDASASKKGLFYITNVMWKILMIKNLESLLTWFSTYDLLTQKENIIFSNIMQLRQFFLSPWQVKPLHCSVKNSVQRNIVSSRNFQPSILGELCDGHSWLCPLAFGCDVIHAPASIWQATALELDRHTLTHHVR